MTIAERLIETTGPASAGLTFTDVRLGLGYSCVELSNGSMGIAWTPDKRQSGSCTHLRHAGSIVGREAGEVLSWLNSDNMLERALGLATFNAVNSASERTYVEGEAISLLHLQPDDHVVMVGHFAPIVPHITKVGCRLEIVELADYGLQFINNSRQDLSALSACDVAIITATSIITNTADTLLAALSRNRAAVLLGPSTPLCPEVFADTRITQLSGAYVTEPAWVKTIVSEGGGTMLLKKHLRFASLPV